MSSSPVGGGTCAAMPGRSPFPAVVATPTIGLTSQTVSFNGSTSETDLWGVADEKVPPEVTKGGQ